MASHYPFLDQSLDALRKAEKDDLRLEFDRMNGEDIERAAGAIFSAPFLRKVHFSGKVNLAATSLLSEALASRTDIEDFGWINNKGQDENVAKAINALEKSTGLKALFVTWNDVGDKTMDAVIRRIEANPDFEHLFATGGTWSQETHDRLAEAVKDKKSLITLNTAARKHDLDDTQLAEALTASPHPNLLTPTGCQDVLVHRLKDTNNAACKRVKDFFVYMPKVASAELIAEHLKPELLYDIESRIPALISCDAFNGNTGGEHLAAYRELSSALPTLEGDVTIDALFKSNHTGFSALENPRTWADNPNLLDKLDTASALTPDAFSLRSPKGNILADMALLNRPLEEVLPVLNRHGIKLQKSALLDAKGEPSELLKRIETRGEVSALFTETNWVGASSQELRATVKALPSSTQNQIPSLNSLSMKLRAAEPSRAGVGR